MKWFLMVIFVGILCVAEQVRRDDLTKIHNLKIELAVVRDALKKCRVECVRYEPRPIMMEK